MNTDELFNNLVSNRVSVQDARDLLVATGHDRVAVQEAINNLISSPNIDVSWTSAGWPRNANIFVVPLDTEK